MNYAMGSVEIDQFAHYFELQQKHLMLMDNETISVKGLSGNDEIIMSFYNDYNAIFHGKVDEYEPLFFSKDQF